MNAIQVQSLHKTYKNGVKALNGLNLTVKSGEIFSLLGQNGAGKSTLIKILTTCLKADSGSMAVCGKNIGTDPGFTRSNIACVSQQISIDSHLSLEENMMFQSELYKVPRDQAKKRMKALIKKLELESFLRYPVASYSGGIKRRLDIAMNMVSGPKILFLDEPTVGMDIQSRLAMWNMMKRIKAEFGTTIFLTTHYLEEADSLSDTICIMRDGQTAVQGSPFELKGYLRQDSVKAAFYTKEHAKAAKEQLYNHFVEYKITVQDTVMTVISHDSRHTIQTVIQFFLEHQILFKGIEITQPSLEDVYIRLTDKETIK